MRRILQYAVLVSYLVITFAAFLFTIARVRVPFLPWDLVHWSYGMMAPYQGEIPLNGELRAEGKDDFGQWNAIDLVPYFPVGFGERNVRMYLRTFAGPTEEYRAKFGELARMVLAIERRQGRDYDAVRLWWDEWPRSKDGFYALRKEPDLRSELIIIVP